jgi:multidrug efflux system outer membrane protein
MKIRTLTALVLIPVTGCAVGPNYVRPNVDAPTTWRSEHPSAAGATDAQWWNQFGDPVLDDLVLSALRESLDIAIAAARVDQFLGAVTSTRSQLFPQLSYAGEASRTRASTVAQPPIPPGADPYFSLYQATLGASWQVDLFGRVRRLNEAARARVYASEQARRGVVLSVVASVAASYIVLRAFDRQLEIAQASARNFGSTEELFDRRHRAGLVARTELLQIRSQHHQALAAIPAFEQAIAAQENLICILLGRNPGPIPRGKSIDQLVAPLIPADLPSALLQRRPDILQAEQNLVAANANIGATRALYYPNISLTGLLGSSSTETGAFLTGPASLWRVAAGLFGPIFTFGAIKGQVRTAEAQTRQAVLVYQQTIFNAFRETNDALTGSQKKMVEAEMQNERVLALSELSRLSRLRFDRGVTPYLDVLVAENELFAAELALVRVRAERYTQVVSVYQAMGGDWVTLAGATTASK